MHVCAARIAWGARSSAAPAPFTSPAIDEAGPVVRRAVAIVRHLQEWQVGKPFDVVAVALPSWRRSLQ